MNVELANIRSAVWAVYFDLREERISVEAALACDALLSTLGQVLELELTQEQQRKDQAASPESAKPPATERTENEL
jgi:hypothetical protein